MKMLTRSFRLMALWITMVAQAMSTGWALGAELRDSKLPSEKRAEQQGITSMFTSPKATGGIDQSVYDEFRRESKDLTSEQKARLIKIFEEKARSARNSGQVDIASYNLQLVNILKGN